MPSIEDFVNNRQADALEELKRLDPDFVEIVSSTVRLQNLDLSPAEPNFGLYAPVYTSDPAVLSFAWQPVNPVDQIPDRVPKQRLPQEWHALLESCYELAMQVSTLRTAADYLKAESYEGMSRVEIGKRSVYHWRSWFIHAKALTERVKKGVIKQTTEVYIADIDERRNMEKRYREAVHKQLETKIAEPRNDFVHANRPRWAKGITDKSLWEGSLAAGLTIQKSLDEFGYPKYADEAESGVSGLFVVDTEGICNILGNILYDLERDIANHRASRHLIEPTRRRTYTCNSNSGKEGVMAEVEVGRVSDFFARPVVAGIELTDTLKVGDRIRITGHTTDLEMVVESMQVDNASASEASAGQAVGVKVTDRVRRGDKVFRITD